MVLSVLAAKSSLPLCRKLFAGIIFLDISGFTRITEFASAGGHYGVELVTQVLNRHFESVSAIVKPHGGEICKFGGDACLILFPCKASAEMPDLYEIRDLLLAACARSDAYFNRKFGINFNVHGALAAGEIDLNIVGKPEHHLDYYLSSDAIRSVYDLAEHALPGEILGNYDAQAVHSYQSHCLSFTPKTSAKADRFLPQSVKLKLQQDRSPAELRNAAVIFIKLTSKKNADLDYADYHDFYTKAQNIVYNHMGVINKIDFTDKGYIMLALFGVPFVFANDIERAFNAARRILLISSESVDVQIGITYSNIYCGIIGSPKRWEYGIIGNAVNISARLMSFAQSGDICLSREMLPKLEGMFETEFVATTSVKGISEPLDIFRLVKELPQRWAQYRNHYQDCELMVAKNQFEDLKRNLAGTQAHFCQITGYGGSGKSLIIWKVCESLMQLNATFELVCADLHAQNLRLEFFFNALRLHLGIEYFKRQFDQIIQWCSIRGINFDPKLLHRNLFAQQAQSRQEAELVSSILYDIVALIYDPYSALVIDNFDRFDPESRFLIIRLIKKFLHDGKSVVITANEILTEISGFPQSGIALNAYTLAQSREFILARIPNITHKAAIELHRISSGNPRFLFELVQHLRRVFTAGCDLITEQIIEEMRHRGQIPDSLENLFISDFERLDAASKALIKYASIYGRPFTPTEIIRIFNVPDKDSFSTALEKLCGMNILRVENSFTEPLYAFSNPLMLESIYRTILLSEKIDLHIKIARYYEPLHTADDNLMAGIIAHHYTGACDKAKIGLWCGRLAERYYQSGSYELSLRYYETVAENAMNPAVKTDAKLSAAGIMLELAANEGAKIILDQYESLLDKPGIRRDRWIRLMARYLINTGKNIELREFLEKQLKSVLDEDFQILIRIDYIESLLYTTEITLFAGEALPLYARLKEEKRDPQRNVLSGIIAAFYSNQGDYLEAGKYYKDKLLLSRRIKDLIGTRIALSGLGTSFSRRGDKDKALKFYRASLETAELNGDRNGYSKALLNIGVIHRNQMEYESALECYQKSLIIARHIGNRLQESIIIYDIGELLDYLGKQDEALPRFFESLEIAKQISDFSGMSFCYDAIGDMYFKRGDYPLALETYQSNLRMQYKMNDREGMAHSFGNLGNLWKMSGRFSHAKKCYHTQIEILSVVGDLDGCGRAWFNLAMLDVEEQDLHAAKTKLEKARELFQSCNSLHYLMIVDEQLEKLV